MLHAPVAESKESSQTTRSVAYYKPQPDLHPHAGITGGKIQGKMSTLQSSIGNQALLRMIDNSVPVPQTQLAMNRPGDVFEQEADRVADHVMSATTSLMVQHRDLSAGGTVRRKCAECAEEEKLKRKPAGSRPVSAVPPIVHDVLRSPGRPLEGSTRNYMESRFQTDFSGVRIHTDDHASRSARAVNALAYTVGRNVVFGAGQYQPASSGGMRLLAHELAHVIQQGAHNLVLQRMVPCPGAYSSPPPSGWKPYHGDSSVFHCGFRGILEDRIPTPDDPQNECFYDFSGRLVDESHPFSGCRGTPNQYDSARDPIRHGLIDSGGILRSGGGAFVESRVHDVSQFFSDMDCSIRRLYGAPC